MTLSLPAISGPNSNTAADFDRDVNQVLRQLRPALAAVLERLDPPVRRAMHLKRTLNLSQQVSWSLFNAATARDPRSMVSLLPGRRGMDSFFAALEGQASVSREMVEQARAAFEQFEEIVARHAGSREEFETMLSDATGSISEPDSAADLKQKRAAFRANSLLWGRQARASCGTLLVHPSQTPGWLDLVLVNGLIDLRRTRRGVPLQLVARRWRWDSDNPSDAPVFSPLDPAENAPNTFGLLREFCSRPLPEFRLRDAHPGYQRYELVSESIGLSSKMTYFTGVINRAGSRMLNPDVDSFIRRLRVIAMPVEAEISDFIVHESVCDESPPDVKVYAASLDGSQQDVSEADLLPLIERSEYLGKGVEAARTPLLPRYTEMLEYAMRMRGWNSDEFRVFRCRVEYPVMHTTIVTRLTKKK